MIGTLLKAFGMILVAELGDKTQFLAIGFATKYKVKDVLIGILFGAFLNHFLAMLIGLQIKEWVDVGILGIASAIIFILFSWFTLIPDKEEKPNKRKEYGAIFTVALAFFIGELGDKTQIAVVILSIDSGFPIMTLLGAVIGMVLIGYLGILIGIKLGNRIPEFYMKLVSAGLFGAIGTLQLFESVALGAYQTLFILVFSTMYIIIFYILIRHRIHYVKPGKTPLKLQAEELHEYYRFIKKRLDNLCLHCTTCGESMCLLGYSKQIIYKALNNQEIDYETLNDKIMKNYDINKIKEAYNDLIMVLEHAWDNEALQSIREIFELIIYKKTLEVSSYKSLIDKLETQEA